MHEKLYRNGPPAVVIGLSITGLGIYEAFQWIHSQVIETKKRRVSKNISQMVFPKPV